MQRSKRSRRPAVARRRTAEERRCTLRAAAKERLHLALTHAGIRPGADHVVRAASIKAGRELHSHAGGRPRLGSDSRGVEKRQSQVVEMCQQQSAHLVGAAPTNQMSRHAELREAHSLVGSGTPRRKCECSDRGHAALRPARVGHRTHVNVQRTEHENMAARDGGRRGSRAANARDAGGRALIRRHGCNRRHRQPGSLSSTLLLSAS